MRSMGLESMRLLELLRQRLQRALDPAPAGVVTPSERPWTPPVEVRIGPGMVTVEMELPGIPREAVDVHIQGATLAISGERRRTPTERSVHQAQRPMGSFSRSFRFPWPLDAEKTTARLERGVLTVRAPRAREGR